jgi:hypothetical protein
MHYFMLSDRLNFPNGHNLAFFFIKHFWALFGQCVLCIYSNFHVIQACWLVIWGGSSCSTTRVLKDTIITDLLNITVLWSRGRSSWLHVWIRFPAPPDFLRSSGSGTGSTQPHEYNWGATWKKSSSSSLESQEYGRWDPSHWPRGTLHLQKLALTSSTSGGRTVSIVCSQTQATEVSHLKWLRRLMD